jgi:pyrophosphatase PpaX
MDHWLKGYRSQLEIHGLNFTPRQIVDEFFYDHDTIPDRHPHLDFPVMIKQVKSQVHDNLSSVALYEGSEDVLLALKMQLSSVSLVTSSPRHMLMEGMSGHNVEHHFGEIICGDDGFGHKPEPGPFAEILKRVGAQASDTLIIGDSQADILGGKAAGCHTCLFTPPENALYHDFDTLKQLNPDYVIDHLPLLIDVMKSHSL